MDFSPNNYVAIMAGGIGSRFWPASRTAKPKQFLDILGAGKSLLQLTFERFLKLCPVEHIFVVTNVDYHELVKAQLPQLSDQQILLEPSRNNTAPCIAYTAFKLQALNPDANLVVAPSDHIILDEANFIRTLQQGLDFTAQSDALLTLGIRPTRPDTGYGYIHFEPAPVSANVHKVRRFTEKPPLATAQAFLDSGEYLWNAGIFVWHTKTILDALQRHAKDIFNRLALGQSAYNTFFEQAFINEYYPATPNISIDFAVMEKAENVYTIPSDFGWSDLGTWASLHTESDKDANGNAVQAADYFLDEVHNCLIHTANEKLVVAKGLDGFIVVDEPDALLIYPIALEQEIKAIAEQLKKQKKDKYL